MIALMIPKRPIMTILIVDGNDVDLPTTQLLAPVVKALDLVAEKSCGSQGGKNTLWEIWIISKYQS